ncbi:MAG: SDR family NAD(P)-dependent oxidoreductase, partial [Chitinophagaceae bacterium]|nr:SDR family NAD(P)-dependent oxidoreductase [Chitinophagaceae bacterium]
MEMKGKKALITGASGGIGKAIAIRLALTGVQVLIHYHKQISEARGVADEIQAAGGLADIISADMSNAYEVNGLVEKAWQMLDGFD